VSSTVTLLSRENRSFSCLLNLLGSKRCLGRRTRDSLEYICLPRLVDRGAGVSSQLNRHHLNFRFSKEIARRMACCTSSTCQRYRLPVDSSRLDFERESTMIPGELLKPSSLISLTSLKVSLLKSCSYSLNSIGHELASRTNKLDEWKQFVQDAH